jgi:hypothetical protein
MHTFPGPDERLLIAKQHQAELIHEAAQNRLARHRSAGAAQGSSRWLPKVILSGWSAIDRFRRLLPSRGEPCSDPRP